MAVPEATAQTVERRSRRRRPFGVAVLALIHLVFAGLSLAAVAGVAEARPGTASALLIGTFGEVQILAIVLTLFPIIALLIALGLWRVDRRAWYAAMVWTGLGLTAQLLLYLGGQQSYVHMVIYVVEAFYLNQREVKDVFRLQPSRVAPVVLEDDREGPR